MRIDVKLREELAQQLYEESDRTGVAWVRRPESVKHAFREAAERKLRGHGEGHAGHGHAHGLQASRRVNLSLPLSAALRKRGTVVP